VKDHANNLHRITKNKTIALDGDVLRMVREVEQPLENYSRDAESLVNLAFTDLAAAHRELPRFIEQSDKLRERLKLPGTRLGTGLGLRRKRMICWHPSLRHSL